MQAPPVAAILEATLAVVDANRRWIPPLGKGALYLRPAILGTGWLKTGHRGLLAAAVVAVLLTISAVVVERVVDTDREKIEATLHQIAALVQQNRIAEVVQYAHSGSPLVRRQAEQLAELKRSGPGVLRAYVRNVRLALHSQAQRAIVEVKP